MIYVLVTKVGTRVVGIGRLDVEGTAIVGVIDVDSGGIDEVVGVKVGVIDCDDELPKLLEGLPEMVDETATLLL